VLAHPKRRTRLWRAGYGDEREIYFACVEHLPAFGTISDFTVADELAYR
jgi:hypothetical protein